MILSWSSCVGAVHCVNQTVAVVDPLIIKHSEVVVFVVHGHVSVWYCYIFQISHSFKNNQPNNFFKDLNTADIYVT